MCIGIAIVGIVPEDGSPIQFFGREGNSSHDTLLSDCIPIELHNRSFKIEYLFPNQIRLDAPDDECRTQVVDFGIAEIQFGVAVLNPEIFSLVCNWLREHPLKHDLKTMQGADLRGADLRGADLRRANLIEADLSGANLIEANLIEANLRGANLRRADLSGANLIEANLRRADLIEADLRRANLYGADLIEADLRRANLYGADKQYAKERGAIVE